MKVKSLHLLISIKKHKELFLSKSLFRVTQDVQKINLQIDSFATHKTVIPGIIKKKFFNKEDIAHYTDYLKNIEKYLKQLQIELNIKKENLEDCRLALGNSFKKRKILEKIIGKHYFNSMRCFNFERIDWKDFNVKS